MNEVTEIELVMVLSLLRINWKVNGGASGVKGCPGRAVTVLKILNSGILHICVNDSTVQVNVIFSPTQDDSLLRPSTSTSSCGEIPNGKRDAF